MLFDGKLPKKPGNFGVIRYAPGTGAFPEDDVCSFDGWYADKADARAIYKDWRRRYAGWVVAVVEAQDRDMHFGGAIFERVPQKSTKQQARPRL
jgi:hypothetical protein